MPRVSLFADNFDRANGPIGSNYIIPTGADTPQIVSNNLRDTASVGGTIAIALVSSIAIPADQYAQADVANASTSTKVGVVSRYSSTELSGYEFFVETLGSSPWTLRRMDNGAPTVLASGIAVVTGTNSVEIEAEGDVLRCFIEGVLIHTENISGGYSSGGVGVLVNSFSTGFSAQLDNFEAGSMGSSGGIGGNSRLRRQLCYSSDY